MSEARFKRKRSELHEYGGKSYPINADDEYRCIPMLLDRFIEQFNRSLEHHSKVLLLRVDLNSHKDSEVSNRDVESLLRWLKQWLRGHYRMTNVGHFWVVERSRAKGIHWHVALMLDGHKVQQSHYVISKIRYRWQDCLDLGLVKIPPNPYLNIKRGDKEAIEKAVYRCSYLTKERSKNAHIQGMSYSASKLKSKALLATKRSATENNT
ncbi:YagK/YfjJ domain-containing protein [Porticoccus sp. GXU_MW_L64]